MAVQEQTPYIEYTANGTATSFALEFDCENQDHLIVLVDDVEPVVGAWSLSNGAVVFSTAPDNGKKIAIQRNTPFNRTTDYQSYNNSFRPPAVNNDFDRVWYKIQELGVKDWLLNLKIQKFRDDVNLTALENTLEEARQIRDDTANSVVEVQSNVAQSQTLLGNTTAQANLAQGYASSANSANAAAQQAVVDVSTAEADVYSALSAQQIAVNNSLTAIAGGHKAYQTLAAAQAAQASLPANSIVEVTNDGANNGTYQWNGTTLTKSAYDPLTQSKDYTEQQVGGLKSDVLQKIYTNLSGDLHQFADVEGNIVAKISHDGQLHVVGLNQPVQIEFVTLNEKVGAVSDTVNRLNYGTDDLYLVTDLDGNIVARIKEDGRYYIVGLANDIATEFASVRDEINKKAESIKDTSIAENRSYKDTVTAQVQTVLNTLMYAQTGAKAPAPLHYFPQNYTINKTWINNINQFGHANSTRLEINSPYRDNDGFVHPHILEFYNGFRGYRYIIAITPYYLTNEAEENPCIYGSNDLINFDLLDGFDQPLDVRPTPDYSTGHNSDNVLTYDPRTGELICIWRQTLRNPNNDGVRVDALWMRKTKDGYSWTDRERIFKATDHALAGGAGSPAIVYDVASGYWHMYLTTLSLTTDAMRLFKAKHLHEDAWEYAGTLVLPFKPWHQDIKIVGNKVCMLVYCYPPDNTIYFGIADDFLNFEWTQNLLLENNAYKSSFVPEFNEQNQMALKILYSTDSSPSEASEKWRMYMHQTNFMNVNLELR